LDASLIANECVDYYLKSNQARVLCKFNIEKAFDHVSKEFLLAILEKMGFPSKWMRWISFCISTVRYLVLINGEVSGFFSSSKGLCQGDPLFPLLFILMMEAHRKLINKACEVGLLKGFHVGNSQSPGLWSLISYLQMTP